MTSKVWIGACGICFCLGIPVGWILAGDPDTTETVIERVTDTITVASVDTLIERDTIHSKPTIKYVPKQIHDTVFIAEKVREYDTEKTFEDSAHVKHSFGIRDIDDILAYNTWHYRPPPQSFIIKEKKVKVYPSKTEKVIKSVAWITAGAGMAAVINNNK